AVAWSVWPGCSQRQLGGSKMAQFGVHQRQQFRRELRMPLVNLFKDARQVVHFLLGVATVSGALEPLMRMEKNPVASFQFEIPFRTLRTVNKRLCLTKKNVGDEKLVETSTKVIAPRLFEFILHDFSRLEKRSTSSVTIVQAMLRHRQD